MYAIVEIQGKQFKVKENDKLEVDTLNKDSGKITFNKVLLYAKDDKNVDIGHPYIDGAYVEAEILKPLKGDKIRVFKKKSKKRYERTIGFRRSLSLIEIKGIAFGAKKAEPKAETKAEPKAELKKEVKTEQIKNPEKTVKNTVAAEKPKAPVKAAAKKSAPRAKKPANKEQAQLF